MTLLIHSWHGANETIKRHWPYYRNGAARKIIGVGTTDHLCEWPHGIENIEIGDGKYMLGSNLAERLLDTIRFCVNHGNDEHFAVIEYDTLLFAPLPIPESVICDRTGGRVFDCKASWFGHNPWIFHIDAGRKLIPEMAAILREGHCSYGASESSPDVFFAYACERANVPVDHAKYSLFSRNSFDIPGALDEARAAYRSGVNAIHGCKTKEELEFILS